MKNDNSNFKDHLQFYTHYYGENRQIERDDNHVYSKQSTTLNTQLINDTRKLTKEKMVIEILKTPPSLLLRGQADAH